MLHAKSISGEEQLKGYLFINSGQGDGIEFNTKPIYTTIEEIHQIFISKFNEEYNSYRDEPLSGKTIGDFNFNVFQQKSHNPVDDFAKVLRQYKIEPSMILGKTRTKAKNDYKRLRYMYLNAIRQVHTDRSPDDWRAPFITTAYEKYNAQIDFEEEVTLGGGKKKIQKGGGIDSGKIFSAMNNLLCKAIIENSLVLMDCVKLGKDGSGSKDFGYFPEIKGNSLENANKINSHKGLRPVFENIFIRSAAQCRRYFRLFFTLYYVTVEATMM